MMSFTYDSYIAKATRGPTSELRKDCLEQWDKVEQGNRGKAKLRRMFSRAARRVASYSTYGEGNSDGVVYGTIVPRPG